MAASLVTCMKMEDPSNLYGSGYMWLERFKTIHSSTELKTEKKKNEAGKSSSVTANLA
jgi:hypothetical protein